MFLLGEALSLAAGGDCFGAGDSNVLNSGDAMIYSFSSNKSTWISASTW